MRSRLFLFSMVLFWLVFAAQPFISRRVGREGRGGGCFELRLDKQSLIWTDSNVYGKPFLQSRQVFVFVLCRHFFLFAAG